MRQVLLAQFLEGCNNVIDTFVWGITRKPNGVASCAATGSRTIGELLKGRESNGLDSPPQAKKISPTAHKYTIFRFIFGATSGLHDRPRSSKIEGEGPAYSLCLPYIWTSIFENENTHPAGSARRRPPISASQARKILGQLRSHTRF